jgi:hypothetical protein
MGKTVFMPSLEDQQQGFRPRALIEGKEADGTDLILSNFKGRYKSLVDKG